MTFQIHALSPEPFETLLAMDDAELSERRACWRTADCERVIRAGSVLKMLRPANGCCSPISSIWARRHRTVPATPCSCEPAPVRRDRNRVRSPM